MIEDKQWLDFIAKHDAVHRFNVDGCQWCGASEPWKFTREMILGLYKEKYG